jgi:hypothetical protein
MGNFVNTEENYKYNNLIWPEQDGGIRVGWCGELTNIDEIPTKNNESGYTYPFQLAQNFIRI